MAEEAAAVATRTLMLLDGASDLEVLPDGEKRAPELLAEGMRAGLIAARAIVSQPLAVDKSGAFCDLKQQRLVSDTAAWLCRLGLRAAEGGERARRDDVLGRLLAAIEAEKPSQK